MSCTILIPTYNRAKFAKLVECNIMHQTYPSITDVIIADDGNERLHIDVPYTVTYIRCKRMSIGEKRNLLKGKVRTVFAAYMDDDDLYHPEFIAQSIFNLIRSGKQLSGSTDMLLTQDGKTVHFQSCLLRNHFNEATLVFTRDYGLAHDFTDTQSAEGLAFCKDTTKSVDTHIGSIMVCVAHSSNTIAKDPWLKHPVNIDMGVYAPHLAILQSMV